MTNRDSKLRKYIYLFIYTLENSKIVETIIVKVLKFSQLGQKKSCCGRLIFENY